MLVIASNCKIFDDDHEHEHEIAEMLQDSSCSCDAGPCSNPLFAPPGIGNRRQALAKLGLLSLRFPLLIRLSHLLLGTRTRGTAAH